MITYKKLKKKPRAFKSIVGVTIAEFEELYRKFVPLWTESEKKRLDRPDRQRAIGGGHPYTLVLRGYRKIHIYVNLTTEDFY